MKKILVVLAVVFLLGACEQNVQPAAPRGNIPQIEISPPMPLPEKPSYEPPPTAPNEQKEWVEHNVDVTLLDFLPSEIKVRKGDKVRLVITARDEDKHFYLDSFGIDEKLPLGEDVIVEFVAGKSGEFLYRTNETEMQGLLIVK